MNTTFNYKKESREVIQSIKSLNIEEAGRWIGIHTWVFKKRILVEAWDIFQDSKAKSLYFRCRLFNKPVEVR